MILRRVCHEEGVTEVVVVERESSAQGSSWHLSQNAPSVSATGENFEVL